jgi:hypothetical protein
MKLKQIFLELLERGIYVPVAIRKKADDKKVMDKEPTEMILKSIGIKNKKDQVLYLSAPIWIISGIGFEKALELFEKGIDPKKDLKPGTKHFEDLPVAAQAYIIYKPLPKIPNKDISKFVSEFMPSKYKTNINYDLVGSYRRSSPFSRDIDILWYDFEKPFDISEFDWHVYSKGPNKLSGIFTTKNGPSIKIDVWIVSDKSHKGSMKLYSTGSKMFNIRQRMHAKKLGYKLNQEGLFTISTNKRIKANTEKDIFKVLKMDYKEPKDRR